MRQQVTQHPLFFFPDAHPSPPGSSDEWYTPKSVFEPLHKEFDFTLDVAATPESAKAPRYYTRAENGLLAPWAGERCWMNPPYSDIAPWVHRAVHEVSAQTAPAQLVVALLPAWTDRRWWHETVEAHRKTAGPVQVQTRFLQGRVRFGYPGNPEAKGVHGGGTFPSVVVVWRRR